MARTIFKDANHDRRIIQLNKEEAAKNCPIKPATEVRRSPVINAFTSRQHKNISLNRLTTTFAFVYGSRKNTLTIFLYACRLLLLFLLFSSFLWMMEIGWQQLLPFSTFKFDSRFIIMLAEHYLHLFSSLSNRQLSSNAIVLQQYFCSKDRNINRNGIIDKVNVEWCLSYSLIKKYNNLWSKI